MNNSDSYLLNNPIARQLYDHAATLPIYDYHCHLSPEEIYHDKPFSDIGQMWLAGDHYKWRLMRQAGVEENYITGDASWQQKFQKYAEVIAYAPGNPLYHWSHMELYKYFGINTALDAQSAPDIREQANNYMEQNPLSPRSLIKASNVKYIATTDDITDSLEYHKLLSLDNEFDVTVAPSFRVDNLLRLDNDGYGNYIAKLSKLTDMPINSLSDLKNAISQRLDYFVSLSCKFSDVGIPYFPNSVSTEEEADRVFQKALNGAIPPDDNYLGFLGHMYLFLAKEYTKRNMVMQLHTMCMRNVNSHLFTACGPDSGGDCIGDPVPGQWIAGLLDAMQKNNGLPKTVLYSLNPTVAYQLSTLAGSFPGVVCGTSWWFCDNKRGIREQMEVVAETGYLGSFLGMLTDSRSFLSYARHDYFRRILCSMIGEWVQNGEYPEKYMQHVIDAICYKNIQQLIEN